MPFDVALKRVLDVASSPLYISATDGKAVRRYYESGGGYTSIMSFTASEADVFAIADAFGMKECEHPIMVLAYDLIGSESSSAHEPSWFNEIRALDNDVVPAAGRSEGSTYKLVFLCGRDGKGSMRMYLRLDAEATARPSRPYRTQVEFYTDFERSDSDQ